MPGLQVLSGILLDEFSFSHLSSRTQRGNVSKCVEAQESPWWRARHLGKDRDAMWEDGVSLSRDEEHSGREKRPGALNSPTAILSASKQRLEVVFVVICNFDFLRESHYVGFAGVEN